MTQLLGWNLVAVVTRDVLRSALLIISATTIVVLWIFVLRVMPLSRLVILLFSTTLNAGELFTKRSLDRL